MAIEKEKVGEICLTAVPSDIVNPESEVSSQEVEERTLHTHAAIYQVRESNGPAKVNSDNYRANFDRIFRKSANDKKETSPQEELQKIFRPKQNDLAN